MKKAFLIGWKDVLLSFRDVTALILMLAAPFALTLGLGFVTGRFAGSDASGLGDVGVVLVDEDGGQLGQGLVALFQSAELAELLAPAVVADATQARQAVDEDRAAAAVIIPAGFTDSIIPAAGQAATGEAVPIEVYANPTRPTSAGIIKTIVEGFVSRVEIGRVAGQVAIAQLLGAGLIDIQAAPQLGADIGARLAGEEGGAAITVTGLTGDGAEVEFDVLAFLAPGLALMFLMFTASNGGRSLLAERAQGTLPRLLVSPTTAGQVLGGKVLGIYLTGVAQMVILIGASTLLFQLDWGDPLGVAALILAAVAGAVGWGMLITALAKTPGQVSAVGSALMLTFGILGGSFISLEYMPGWFAILSKITPNAWGLDGFTTLALGGQLGDILLPVAALLVMGAVLFGLAVFLITRRGIVEQ